MVGRAQAWAGGTFLHHLLPKPSRTGPALPARPADSVLQEPSQLGSLTHPQPTPTCFPTTVALVPPSAVWGKRRW